MKKLIDEKSISVKEALQKIELNDDEKRLLKGGGIFSGTLGIMGP